MKGLALTAGGSESWAWLGDLGLEPGSERHWYVEITIESDEPSTRFELNIYPEEWGYVLRSGRRVSSIRITDQPFVHGLDDHKLVAATPQLAAIRGFLGALEARYGVTFARAEATVKSTFARARAAVHEWLAAA